ncbi:hypothetical protein RJ641_025439 [Dillenia turbinata]|uniref:U1-type domain-containing protein n=1 Tax=Dillenia turbinata TaxID=194707 RepID=A0AAN8WEA8_9MAGN
MDQYNLNGVHIVSNPWYILALWLILCIAMFLFSILFLTLWYILALWLPRPSNQNHCGVEQKATTPPMATMTELSPPGTKKRPTEEWSCALCQVTATSKEGLDEHLQGRRHKAKKVELRAQKAGTKSGTTSSMATITGLSPAGARKKPTEWCCNLCQVTATSKEGLDEHLQGKRHKAKKAELREQKAGTKSGTISPMATITELSPAGTRKKPTKEWSCNLCQVTATSKEGLNKHLQGRKHKAMEAGLRAQKAGNKSGNISASIESMASFTPSLKQDLKHKDLSQNDQHDRAAKKGDLQDLKKNELDPKEKYESELQKKVEVETTKNDGKEVKLGVPKMERPKKKNRKFKFMCEMCQVETNSEVDMTAHKKGRKHRARLEMHQKLLH